MTKGLIKLGYKGNNDKILIGNPQVCFWKNVYKQHTNFVKESMELKHDDGYYMNNTQPTIFKFRIDRNADLVTFASLSLTLPEIYSKKGDNGEFTWIENIGASMIEYARLYYDDILIEEIDGDFLIVNRDMLLNNDKKNNFNKLIGHDSCLTNPYINNVYPSYTNISGDLSGTDFYINSDYNSGPSIKEYKLNVPLLFCFFREKSFIPLISLKYREVFIEIKLRPLKDLYTIIEREEIKLNIPADPLSYLFMTPLELSVLDLSGLSGETLSDASQNTVNFDRRVIDPVQDIFRFTQIPKSYFVPTLELEYIFLDNKERKSLALHPFSQTFSFNKKLTYKSLEGLEKLYIKEYHPLQSLYLVTKRDDISTRNQWSNYSNNDFEGQETLYLQNYFTLLAKDEAKNQGHTNFFKHLGTFLGKGNQNYTCIIQKNDYTDVSGRVHSLKGYDFLIKKPKFNKKITFNLILKFLLIIKYGQNYIGRPIIRDNKGHILPTDITLKHGQITNINFTKSNQYNDYSSFTVDPQLYLNGFGLVYGGEEYNTLPNIYIGTSDNLEKVSYSADINNKKISNGILKSKILLSEEVPIYIGGELTDILNIERYTGGSLYFFDCYNDIISPTIKIIKNKLEIIKSGAGLTKYTKLCIGKILSNINLKENTLISRNIASYELVPKFYSKFLKEKYNSLSTTSPKLEIKYKPLTTYTLDYEIDLKETEIINLKKINKKISNKKISFELGGEILLDRDIFLHIDLNTNKTSINIGKYKSKIRTDIKILHNFSKDITDSFTNIKWGNLPGFIGSGIMFSGGDFRDLNINPFSDKVSLYIGGKEISTIIPSSIENIVFAANQTPDYNCLNKYSNKLIFVNLTNDIFSVEYGKEIDSITIKDNIEDLTLTLSNNVAIFKNLLKNCNIEKKNYFSKETQIEFDFGGGVRPLNDFVDYFIEGGELKRINFNENYYEEEIKWTGYRKDPIFIVKDISIIRDKPLTRDKVDINLLREHTNSSLGLNYRDGLVGGVIDFGGSNFNGTLVNKSSGFDADIYLEKINKIEYEVKCRNLGYNYNEDVNCSLVSYEIIQGKLYKLNILDSFILKTNILGKIDISKGILWKNNKSFSKIEIINNLNTKTSNYTIFNTHHNINTNYKIIIGCVPDESVGIINCGENFSDEAVDLLYTTSHDKLLFKYSFDYKTSITNGKITSLICKIPKLNNINLPLISYEIKDNQLHLKRPNIIIETKKQLTGFKIIDSGTDLTRNTKLYNGFITKLPKINSGVAFIQNGKDKIPLITGKNGIELYPTHKFLVFNNNFTYDIPEYKNLILNKKFSEQKTLFIQFTDETYISVLRNEPIYTLTPKFTEKLYTLSSEIYPSTIIDDVTITDPGNELDSVFKDYKLIFRDIDRRIIETNNIIIPEFNGINGEIKTNSIFDLVIKGDGGGFGCTIEPKYMIGDGCNLLSIMGVNKASLNCGGGFDGKDLNLGYTNSDHLCSNIYTWNTIPNSSLISNRDWITVNDIKKFMNIWRYRSPMDVPILNKKNYDFYKSGCIVNKFGVNIDFKERENIRDAYVYKTLEKYYTMKEANYNNNILYSFCLNNSSFQSTGNVNLNSLDNLCLNLELKNPSKDSNGEENYKYDADVFLKYHNVIEYVNGKGGLKYGN